MPETTSGHAPDWLLHEGPCVRFSTSRSNYPKCFRLVSMSRYPLRMNSQDEDDNRGHDQRRARHEEHGRGNEVALEELAGKEGNAGSERRRKQHEEAVEA